MEADMDLMEEILASVDWKSGIRPLGNLATQACFVQKEMPIIKRLVGNHSTSLLVTQSSWTSNLVDVGVISNLNDDTTMHSLSELHLLFHTRQQQPGHRTLHHLHLDSQAYFSVNHILRPTIKFQKALEAALAHIHDDQQRAWQELCKVWHDFGFLWPQKIILGHRHHVKHNYQVRTDSERVYKLQVARDHTSALLDMELRKSQSKEKTRKSIGTLQDTCHDTHHITGQHPAPIFDTDWLRRNSASWKVIKRDDIRPIYEFLPASMRDTIHHLIQVFVHRIPLNQPFMLRSVSTNGYLSWRSNPKQHHATRTHDSGYDNSTGSQSATHNNLDRQPKAPILFSTLSLDLMKTTGSSCIWKFSDNINVSLSQQTFLSPKTTSKKYVRCGSQLYLAPNTPPGANKDIILTRSTSASSTAPLSSTSPISMTDNNPLRPPVWDLYVEKASRVRPVEFFDKHPSIQNDPSQHQWTVETPDLGLDMDDDFSTDGHLNVDIAIGRQKPILDQEIISLRQILYLCSVHNQISYSSSSPQRNPSQSPPIVIPSPVPPGAAGVMAMFRKISSDNNGDDDQTFSHHHSARLDTNTRKTIKTTANDTSPSSSSTLPMNSTTSNASIATLPYYNLHTYTVLPQPPLMTTSNVSIPLSPTLNSPYSLSTSPPQHCYNPVLAKEHSLISGPEESYWVIELLPKGASGDQLNIDDINNPTCIPPTTTYLLDTTNTHKDRTTIHSSSNHEQRRSPGPTMRLKMVMSSDTLRDDASSPSQDASRSTIRRVHSYSSVHDAHYLQQQHYQHHQGTIGFGALENNSLTAPSSSSPLPPQHHGIAQDTTAPNVGPYLELYTAKQNNKTWSHVIKNSTLANLKRWLKTE